MTTTNAAAASTTTTAATGAAASKPVLSANFNTFLTLLTTQLKNQSPDDPLDTNEMTGQLVQFAGVEQQISMNGNLEKMIALQQTSQLTAAAPMLGQRVEVEGSQIALQDGRAEIRLPAAGAASQAHITVRNSAGRILREADVTLGSAAQSWNWNGKDSTGTQVANGAYSTTVTGIATGGAVAPLTWTSTGTATAVERNNGALQLMLGKAGFDFDKVRSVTAPG
ncbi:flagellar hook assembly protein FlgD [Roseomonas sp. BN140053]|uniref:flagellar hook assembly protein FlgD n=1 Tax=Roseomonas sp. BN140053 TaxID=3391898 RepID=UPI0039EB22A0